MVAYKQPRNLRSMLVQATLTAAEDLNTGNRNCNKPRCQVCKHLALSPTIFHGASGRTLKPGNFNCDTSNVVYLLFCNKCPHATYIGETSTKFRLRFNNHKLSVRNNNPGFPVAEHFNLPEHTLSDLKCVLSYGNFKSAQERCNRELKTIISLNTHRTGLNRDLAFMSRLQAVGLWTRCLYLYVRLVFIALFIQLRKGWDSPKYIVYCIDSYYI